MDYEIYEIEVEMGALKNAPIWEDHKRGKNWLAEISPDPKSPGGLKRKFWEHARGSYYYIIPSNVQLPTAIEFGADYYSGRGNKYPKRWYGVIVSISQDKIVIEKCETASQAIKRAQELKSQVTR